MKKKLSHLDTKGRAKMVDVSSKEVTRRRAVAESVVRATAPTIRLAKRKGLPKGDLESVVRLAAICGAKRTDELIPLCHPLQFDHIEIGFRIVKNTFVITAEVSAAGRTGLEMEAMTAAATGALALYDMIKGVEKGAEIIGVRLLEKSGGKSGSYRR